MCRVNLCQIGKSFYFSVPVCFATEPKASFQWLTAAPPSTWRHGFQALWVSVKGWPGTMKNIQLNSQFSGKPSLSFLLGHFKNTCELFTRSFNVHLCNTRFFAAKNLYVNVVILNVNLVFFWFWYKIMEMFTFWLVYTYEALIKKQIHRLLLTMLGI